MNAFNLIIIGDEILHGSRQDKHFAFFKSLLESHGLKLNQVQYLPDEPDLLVKQLRRSFFRRPANFRYRRYRFYA